MPCNFRGENPFLVAGFFLPEIGRVTERRDVPATSDEAIHALSGSFHATLGTFLSLRQYRREISVVFYLWQLF